MAVYGYGNLLIGEAYCASPDLTKLKRMIRSEEQLDMHEFLSLINSVYESIKSEKDL
jgi:hypothetical protein